MWFNRLDFCVYRLYTISTMENTKQKRLGVPMTVREKEMLDQITGYLGCNASEWVRSMIREKFTKLFPVYTQRAQIKAGIRTDRVLTPEEMCEQAGGKCGINAEGAKVCIFTNGHIKGSVTMDQPEQFKVMAKRIGLLG